MHEFVAFIGGVRYEGTAVDFRDFLDQNHFKDLRVHPSGALFDGRGRYSGTIHHKSDDLD